MKITIVIIALSLMICPSVFAGELPDIGQLHELCRNVFSLDHETQQKAVASISRLPLSAIPAFAALLNSESEAEDVRSGAAAALGIFGASARPYIPDLARALNGTSISLSQSAAGALSDLVNQTDSAVVPALVRRLVNRRPDCSFECFWSITALGKIGQSAREALPVLRQIVNDRRVSSAVQAEAQKSIDLIETVSNP